MDFETIRSTFTQAAPFSSLAKPQQAALFFTAKVRRFPAGAVLYKRGEANADTFLLMLDGEVSVLSSVDGKEVAHPRGPGTVIGEAALVTRGHTRTKDVVARTPIEALEFSAKAMQATQPEAWKIIAEAFETLAFERLAQELG